MSTFNYREFLAPRYWPVWLLVGLMVVAARLPLGLQRRLATGLGRLTWLLRARRRQIAQINIDLCFPHLSAPARRALARDHLSAAAMGLFETATAWWAPDERIGPRIHISGLEHLHAARASGKGIILLTGHSTCLELGARALTAHSPFHGMYRQHKNALFEALMMDCRLKRSRRVPIARDDVRGVLRALRRGEAVWYAPDQNYGGTDAVFAPFFGVPALTITATGRMAAAGRAIVLPYWPIRLPGNRGYEIVVEPPWSDFPSGDDLADATRVNQWVESCVLRAPEQYLWVHRRFKTRPPGQARLY